MSAQDADRARIDGLIWLVSFSIAIVVVFANHSTTTVVCYSSQNRTLSQSDTVPTHAGTVNAGIDIAQFLVEISRDVRPPLLYKPLARGGATPHRLGFKLMLNIVIASYVWHTRQTFTLWTPGQERWRRMQALPGRLV